MNYYPQAPQSVGKVLDGGFTMFRATLKPMLPLTLVFALVSCVPQLVPYLMKGEIASGISGIGGWTPGLIAGLLAWVVLDFALYLGWLRSLDAVARGGAPLDVAGAFSAGLPKILRLIGASLLFALAVALGSVLLLVPGLILMVSLAFFAYLIVLEDKGAVESLKASHDLVWGNWWRTLAVISVGAVIYIVAFVIVVGTAGAALGISAFRDPSPEQLAGGVSGAVLVLTVLQVALTTLLMPMWGSLMLVLLRDLQLRRAPAGSS